MNKLLVVAFSVLVTLVGALASTEVNAQQQFGTYAYCNGRWIFGGCGGGFPVVQQQQIPFGIPGGVLPGGLSKCEIVGGIAGGTLGSFAKNHTTQAVILAALVGGAAGNYFCQTTSGQNVVLSQGQMTTARQGGQVVVSPSQCLIDGVAEPIFGATQEQCNAARIAAGTRINADAQRQNRCAAGLSWKKLDWPGHKQHDTEACLPSEEVLQADEDKVCKDGFTWRKLEKPGHQQHGTFVCFPKSELQS